VGYTTQPSTYYNIIAIAIACIYSYMTSGIASLENLAGHRHTDDGAYWITTIKLMI